MYIAKIEEEIKSKKFLKSELFMSISNKTKD